MNILAAIPIPLRYLILGFCGAYLGRLAHWITSQLQAELIGAGEHASVTSLSSASSLRWLPIMGPLYHPHAAVHRARTARDMVVELVCTFALPAWYAFEVLHRGLWQFPDIPPAAVAALSLPLHEQFLAHVALLFVMLAASLIDLEERIIPDVLVVPGALVGLLLAAALPQTLLPAGVEFDAVGAPIRGLQLDFTSPNPLPQMMVGGGQTMGLVCGIAIFIAWCLALLPRRWYGRRGWRRAVELILARIVRDPYLYRVLGLALVGVIGISLVWWLGGRHWEGLLTSLMGLGFGGGLIWGVRLASRAALGREAMGFGDVTLMAMIGSYLGWQPCVLIFFIGPMFALVWGVAYLLLGRGNEIPYGPFLCLGATSVMLGWPAIWSWAEPLFALGFFIPGLMAGSILVLFVLLAIWRVILMLAGR